MLIALVIMGDVAKERMVSATAKTSMGGELLFWSNGIDTIRKW